MPEKQKVKWEQKKSVLKMKEKVKLAWIENVG